MNTTDAIQALLDSCPELQVMELLLPDINGILRGKRINRDEFGQLCSAGINLPASAHLVDSRGMSIDGLDAGSADGDPDYLCRPVPASFAPVPWADPRLGQCLISMYQADGRPYFADARHVLGRVNEQLAGSGYRAVVAIELEFYLLADDVGGGPRARLGRIPGLQRHQEGPQLYSLEDLHELESFFSAIDDVCSAQGIPASTAISEYAPGQYEINLRHVDDAARACDHAVLLRRTIRGVARRHRMAATFMAKPFAGHGGSGMHVHVSLLDGAGRPVFRRDGSCIDGVPASVRHAVGGLVAAMDESMAIFCPNANSYRRLRPGSFAPVSPNWGCNHRNLALRIPLSDDDNIRIEHRVPGADANPYLVVAAILAGMHHGLVNRIEPPEMIREKEVVKPGKPTLPLHWNLALSSLEEARILPAGMGPEFIRVFGQCRRCEAERFQAQVSNIDYDWYLRVV